MIILSTELKWQGKKTVHVKVEFDGYKYTIKESFGQISIETNEMEFDEANREYLRIIRAYFWDVNLQKQEQEQD